MFDASGTLEPRSEGANDFFKNVLPASGNSGIVSRALSRLHMISRHLKSMSKTTDTADTMSPGEDGRVVLTTDVPDPDNFLMVLRTIKDSKGKKVDIIISPRPVSFTALPYGKEWAPLSQSIGKALAGQKEYDGNAVRKMISPVTQADAWWIEQLPAEHAAWFYRDEGFENHEVLKDTQIYMEVSRLRFIAYLDAHGIDRSLYRFYTDKNFSSVKTIRPGIRHAAHKADFTFHMTPAQKAEYVSAVDFAKSDEGDAQAGHSRQLGEVSHRLCEQYVANKTAELGVTSSHDFNEYKQLAAAYKDSKHVEFLVGGPFTEAAELVRDGLPVTRVTAMAGFVDGSSNLLDNQFNFFIDMEAGKAMLRMAEQGRFELRLLPTECVKGSAYELSKEEFAEHVAQWSPATKALYDDYSPGEKAFKLFDIIAVMTLSRPELFNNLKPVSVTDYGDVIRFTPADLSTADGPGLKMYWNAGKITGYNQATGAPELSFNDDEYMAEHKSLLLDELRRTFV